jgi:hypothetical protein
MKKKRRPFLTPEEIWENRVRRCLVMAKLVRHEMKEGKVKYAKACERVAGNEKMSIANVRKLAPKLLVQRDPMRCDIISQRDFIRNITDGDGKARKTKISFR